MAFPGLGLGICIQPLKRAIELRGLGAVAHRLILFAEDWHGHRGQEHQALCL